MSEQITTPRASDAETRGEGICRNCLAPIWNEGGTVNHRRHDTGWSDRIEHSGDSLVCFKAVEYRHVPLTGREAAIYDRAFARGAREALLDAERGIAKYRKRRTRSTVTAWASTPAHMEGIRAGLRGAEAWLRTHAAQIGGTP